MALLSGLGRFKDTGLLLMRLGLGLMFILHGYPKLVGGPERWEGIGGAMKTIGIDFLPLFWGLSATLVELIGGLFLILGLFFRPTCLLLAFTMLIAALFHLSKGDGVMGSSHAIELGIVFVGLLFVGPGRYSVDKR